MLLSFNKSCSIYFESKVPNFKKLMKKYIKELDTKITYRIIYLKEDFHFQETLKTKLVAKIYL